jgi:hypothetical protein
MFETLTDAPTVLNRVRVKYGRKYLFGVHVPHTSGTVICDGHARRIVQVEPKEMTFK